MTFRRNIEWTGTRLTVHDIRTLADLTQYLPDDTHVHVSVDPGTDSPTDRGGTITIKVNDVD